MGNIFKQLLLGSFFVWRQVLCVLGMANTVFQVGKRIIANGGDTGDVGAHTNDTRHSSTTHAISLRRETPFPGNPLL